MEEGNEYERRNQKERNQLQSQQLAATLEYVKGIDETVKAIYKEIRLVREDLRNLENLRPLRKEVTESTPDSE